MSFRHFLVGVLLLGGGLAGCGQGLDTKQPDQFQYALAEMKIREDALAAELKGLRVELKDSHNKSEDLQRRIHDQEIQLLKLQAEATKAAAPAKPTFPTEDFIKGKVTRIAPEDPTMMEVDIGSDRGVQTGQMLAVYRPDGEPVYLGSLRVLQTLPTRAMARLVRTNPLKKATIKVGDEVAER